MTVKDKISCQACHDEDHEHCENTADCLCAAHDHSIAKAVLQQGPCETCGEYKDELFFNNLCDACRFASPENTGPEQASNSL